MESVEVLTRESSPLLLPTFSTPSFYQSVFSANDLDELGRQEESRGDVYVDGRRVSSVPCLHRSVLDSMALSTIFFEQHFHAGGGSMTSTAFNLACSTLGAGTLALPFALHNSGIVTGFLALSFICVSTIYTVFLIGKVFDHTSISTMEELARHLICPAAAHLVSFFIVFFCWGVGVMYVVMMGDFMKPLLPYMEEAGVPGGREWTMFLFWLVIMLPLSILKDVTSLKYASIIGTASTLVLAVALLTQVTVKPASGRGVTWMKINVGTISSMSTYFFSYCCQPIVLPVYREMEKRSIRKLTLSATYSMVTCTVIYIISGVCGEISYRDAILPNILLNFAPDLHVPQILLAYVGMAFAVTLAFPMAVFPTRDSITIILGYGDSSTAPTWIVRLVGATLAFIALILGMLIPNVYVLFDVIGGVCGGMISFILPGVLALLSGALKVDGKVPLPHLVMSWTVIISGCLMVLLGGYSTVRNDFLS